MRNPPLACGSGMHIGSLHVLGCLLSSCANLVRSRIGGKWRRRGGIHQRKRNRGAHLRRLAAVKTGGVWKTPVLLGSGSPASDIKVAPNGDVLAIWSFRTSNTYVPVEAQAAFFSGGRWGPTWTITTSQYGNVYNFGPPSIGFDGNNQATVVWEEYNGSTCSVVTVTGTGPRVSAHGKPSP